jgi:hypothetical protein
MYCVAVATILVGILFVAGAGAVFAGEGGIVLVALIGERGALGVGVVLVREGRADVGEEGVEVVLAEKRE